jgi:hypothetical protein
MKLSILIIPLLIILISQSFAQDYNQHNKVLFIGDSHSVGPFGTGLHEKLVDNQWYVHLLASCSSTPSHWVKGGFVSHCGTVEFKYNSKNKLKLRKTIPLSLLFSTDKPDFVIIALGANLAKTSKAKTGLQLKSIAQLLSGKPCFWIGPPDSPKLKVNQDTFVYPKLKEIIQSKCKLFDSRPATRIPEENSQGIEWGGTHYAPGSIVNEWVKEAFVEFSSFTKERRENNLDKPTNP